MWRETWNDMSGASKRKEKLEWTIEKPKLDKASKLRGMYFTDPADEEFKKIYATCAEKVRSSDASSYALQDQEKNVQRDL